LYDIVLEKMTDSVVERKVGNVKWFNNKAGYGFITMDEKSEKPVDVFVHYSHIRVTNTQYKYLVQGEYVEFTLSPSVDGRYEFHAIDVSGINGGATLCERRKVSREESKDSPDSSVKPEEVVGLRKPRRRPQKTEDGFVTVRRRANRTKPVGL
jgi:cold shock CspA family protein